MAHVPRMFCACGGEMKNQKTGVILEVTLPDQDDEPYYKISSDRHECVDCGAQVFLLAAGPVAHPFEESRWEKFETQHHARIRG